MAKRSKTTTSKSSTAKSNAAPKSASRRFLRYCAILGLLAVVALAWLSLLSFSPTDPPSDAIYPPKRPVDNRAGLVGAYLAFGLRYWLGIGAYVLTAGGTIAGLVLLTGRRIGEWPWRLTGLALLTVAASAGAQLARPEWYGEVVESPGGAVGSVVGGFLGAKFGSTGSWIVTLMAGGIGLMLAGDTLLKILLRRLRGLWGRRSDMAEAFAELRRQRKAERQAAKAAKAGTTACDMNAAATRTNTKPASDASAQPATTRTQDKPQPSRPTEPARSRPDRPKEKQNTPAAKPDESQRPRSRRPASRNGSYTLPSVDLLAEPEGGYDETAEQHAEERKVLLQQTLSDFNVEATVEGFMTGPVITLFEISLAPGVKVSTITNLATDIARSLAVPGVRIVPPRFGKHTVGIEVPNLEKETVRIRELMNLAPDAEKNMSLPLYLGKDAGGSPIVLDLSEMPHALIAGTTGSGKSVCINTIIISLLMTRTPEDVRFILVDPKMVEMAAFEKLPHLLCPTINDMKKAEGILEWACSRMDERYELLREAGVRTSAAYNALGEDELYERLGAETEEEQQRIATNLPSYVIIIDELADMMMTSRKEVEASIIRIAQKARAVGIHLVLATQRPSADVVTGLIKSNMPCRISFQVASGQESRIVLDQKGAEVLMGKGDMLVLPPGTSTLIRAQGTFVDDQEIRAVCKVLNRSGDPMFDEELVALQSGASASMGTDRDDMFDQAVEVVLQSGRGSVSLLQRRLQIGYGRASRIIDQMAEAGIIGTHKGSQAREVLLTMDDWEQMKASIAADQSGDNSANGEPTSV